MADSKRWSRRDLLRQSGIISVGRAATALVPGGANALAHASSKAATAKTASLEAGQILAHDQVPFYNDRFKVTIQADQLALTSTLPIAGYPITCSFKGKVDGNTMSGSLIMGEYGEVLWDAVRA